MKRFRWGSRPLPRVALLLAAWLGGGATLDGHVEAIEVGVANHGVERTFDLAAAHPGAPEHLERSRAADREPPCAACEQERRGLGWRPLASRPMVRAGGVADPAAPPALPPASALLAPSAGRAPPSR
jgi:hypothetical protein